MSALPAIGICSWSINRRDPLRSMEIAATEFDLRAIQLGFFTREALDNAKAEVFAQVAATHGVRISGIFAAFEQEDYSSIGRITQTGGLSSNEHESSRMETLRTAAQLAAGIVGATSSQAAPLLGIHAGTIPVDKDSLSYLRLLARVREAADVCAECQLRLLLETGRECAESLAGFTNQLGRPNVGINFDPANFVIYGTDDPVRAIAPLKGVIELVHLKDATSARQAGAFGTPAAFGHGDVQIPRVLSKLRAAGYAGPLLIETPHAAGMSAIRDAASFLRSMF